MPACTDARRRGPTERNGHRPRTLSTEAGDIELGIPKLRKGSFFPSILEPRRRIDQHLYAVVMEAYVQGVSTRAVDELVQAFGIGRGHLPLGGVPHLRPLGRARRRLQGPAPGPYQLPFVYLDATYLHVCDDHHVVSKAVVIATGVRPRACAKSSAST